MSTLGDVKINGKWYRINVETYRNRDIVDFSPRAASPGGGAIMSDLMLYQPLMQTDWRHGFGFKSFDDAAGYFNSVGNVDTRHEGMAMLFTNRFISDLAEQRKSGACMHHNVPYFYGLQGVRKYTDSGWEDVSTGDETSILMMYSLGEKLFVSPLDSRIRMSGESGMVVIQKDEKNTKDTYIKEDQSAVNFNTKPILRVGTSAASLHMTSFLKFNLDDIPAGASITKATLVLHVLEKTTSVPDVHIARCLVAAKEKIMTWNKYDTSLYWTGLGGTGLGTDRSSTEMFSGVLTAEEGEPFSMDLDVSEFSSMVADNHGMFIYDDYPGSEIQNIKFSNSKDANASWRPQLIVRYTLATDWEDTGQSADSKNYHWACAYNGFTYLGVLDTNRVHYTSDPELADIEATDNDPSAIKVGASTIPTIGAINFLGSMYIAKSDGLWQMGEDKIARNVLNFSSEAHSKNFNSMAVHNGYLVFPVLDTLYQWNGHRLNVITPGRISDSFPYITYGEFKNLITVGDYLYCTARTNEETYSEVLLCYDGVGWHKLADLIKNGYGSISLLYFDTYNNYLWHHIDKDEPKTYYTPFQELSEFPYQSFPITGTHSIYSSINDMGFSRISKSSPSLLLEGSNLSSSHYLSLYFRTDGETEWTPWGQMIEDGTKEFTFPAGLRTIEYKTIQLRVDFTTTDALNSPVLNGITLRFLMRPDVSFGWNFDIVAADHFVYGEREDTRTAAVIISDIKQARDSKSPVEFTDLEGNTYFVYISAMATTAQERNVDEQNGLLDSVESILNISLVEAK